MARVKKAVSQERVFQIQSLLLDGVSNYEIVRTCSAEWDVSERQVYKYIKYANEKIEQVYHDELADKIGWHFIARKRLYYKAVSAENYSLAHQVLRDIGELQGLYKTKLTGDKDDPVIVQIVTAAAKMGLGE